MFPSKKKKKNLLRSSLLGAHFMCTRPFVSQFLQKKNRIRVRRCKQSCSKKTKRCKQSWISDIIGPWYCPWGRAWSATPRCLLSSTGSFGRRRARRRPTLYTSLEIVVCSGPSTLWRPVCGVLRCWSRRALIWDPSLNNLQLIGSGLTNVIIYFF
jgi:hypothetical protein